jgi:hypothetical protein
VAEVDKLAHIAGSLRRSHGKKGMTGGFFEMPFAADILLHESCKFNQDYGDHVNI